MELRRVGATGDVNMMQPAHPFLLPTGAKHDMMSDRSCAGSLIR